MNTAKTNFTEIKYSPFVLKHGSCFFYGEE